MRRLVHCLLLLPLLLAGFPTISAHSAEAEATPIAFDVRVSLEWQPGTNDVLLKDLSTSQCSSIAGAGGNYLDELLAGLNQASNYLMLYSGGQMKLGTVTISTGGANWSSANIRVLADSSYRPKAFVGGIVTAPMTYASPLTNRSQTFYPGAIHLGRLWNGTSARCGAWVMSDGYRTIGHEWAHYALFLYDEYYNQHTLAPVYCTTTHQHLPSIPANDPSIDSNDSLMAYHYRAGQLWHGGPSDGTCDHTPQMWIHGESDWDTVKRFYPGISYSSVETKAESLPWTIDTVDALPSRSTANVRVRNTIVPGAVLSGQGYIVRMNSDKTPQRIIGQGMLVADEVAPLPFLGVEDPLTDRGMVIMQDPQYGTQYVATSDTTPLVIDQDKLNELFLRRNQWKPCMSMQPTLTTSGSASYVTQLTVRLRDCAGQTSRVQLAYCPSGGVCQAPVTKLIDGSGSFVHTFNFPGGAGLTEYGYIYARTADLNEPQEETIAWYQLAGGVGPATITGHAPLLERTVDLAADTMAASVLAKTDSYVLYSGGVPSRAASSNSLPTSVAGIIDMPIDVQPVVLNGTSSQGWNAERGDPALTIRLSYNQDLLNRMRISESQLVLLRLDHGSWRAIQSRQRSAHLDWLAIDAQTFRGSGATFALGYLK